jgi:hypothetical protein
VFFFFQKKKQKALFRFAEEFTPVPRHQGTIRTCLQHNFQSSILLFPEKEAKSVVPLRGRVYTSTSSSRNDKNLHPTQFSA